MEIDDINKRLINAENLTNSLLTMLENNTVTLEDYENFINMIDRNISFDIPSDLRYFDKVSRLHSAIKEIIEACRKNREAVYVFNKLKFVKKHIEEILSYIEIE